MVEAGREPLVVVTHPDRPVGRGRKIYPAPIRLVAEELGLPCRQPEDVNAPEFVKWLEGEKVDAALVISFGQIFSPALLAAPRLGCFNLHGSLLPRHRGAAPVRHAILAGDEESGVTVIKMTAKMDAGPMLLHRTLPIGPREKGGELRERVARLAGELVPETLTRLAGGELELVEQDEKEATYAGKLTREAGHLDWLQPALEIDRMVRAFNPQPGAFTNYTLKRLKILEGTVEDFPSTADPGTLLSAGEEGIRVATGDVVYRITGVRPDGSRTMSAGEWVRGCRLVPDARFV